MMESLIILLPLYLLTPVLSDNGCLYNWPRDVRLLAVFGSNPSARLKRNE